MNGNFNAKQVAADRARRDIPKEFAIIFEDITDSDLEGIITNSVPPYPYGEFSAKTRMHARAEADYREAFGVVVDLDPRTGRIRRRTITTPEELQSAIKLAEQEKRQTPPVNRTRWTPAGTAATLKRQMAAAPTRTCEECGAEFNTLHGPELCTACWTKRGPA